MASPPIIRRIGVEGLESVRELAMIIWPKCYRNIIAPDMIDTMLAELYDVDALDHEMTVEGVAFWIASVGPFDVGYAAAVQKENRLWLKKLYVRDEYRGLGIGQQFIKAAQELYPNASDMALNVNYDNLPAIAYYKKSGFEIEAEVPVRMGPFDFKDYVMTKRLYSHAA